MSSLIKAQSTKAKAMQHDLLMNTWFESPHESHGDTMTYRLTRHLHTPGVDDPKALFSIIVFSAPPDFTVENWRWCPKSKFLYGGKWNIINANMIKLDFGTVQKCKCQLSIITLEKELLKVVVKTVSN